MPKLRSIVADTATVDVPFGPEHVTVTYRPILLTQRLAEQLQGVTDNATVMGMLAGLLVSWDLEDDDGRAIPTTADGLKDVPTPVLVRVAEAVAASAASSPIAAERLSVVDAGRRR